MYKWTLLETSVSENPLSWHRGFCILLEENWLSQALVLRMQLFFESFKQENDMSNELSCIFTCVLFIWVSHQWCHVHLLATLILLRTLFCNQTENTANLVQHLFNSLPFDMFWNHFFYVCWNKCKGKSNIQVVSVVCNNVHD